MTRIGILAAGVAALALTFGLGGQGNLPMEIQVPWSNHDIVIVKNDAGPTVGQTDNGAQQSAEMGKDNGNHGGQNQAAIPKTKSDKMSGAQSSAGPSSRE